MFKKSFFLVFFALLPIHSAFAANYAAAEFLILNKITTEKETIKVSKLKNYVYSGIELKLLACQKDYKKESNQALITISKTELGRREQVFSGWTFSHSPAISMLEHPIYNVILLKCTGNVL